MLVAVVLARISGVISEILMVVIGAMVIPRCMPRGGLARTVAQSAVAGGAMLGSALLLVRAPPAAAITTSLVAYVTVLGAVARTQAPSRRWTW
jgi:hypothetical protein